MRDADLSDDDHFSRYCKPSTVDASGLPMASAFKLRKGEPHLSANWLEYFGGRNVKSAIGLVREALRKKDYTIKRNGRFAVLNVGATKSVVREKIGRTLSIKHLPCQNDESHAGVLGYTEDDLTVAVHLKALVSSRDVYPALG